jgi:hypothetical protein
MVLCGISGVTSFLIWTYFSLIILGIHPKYKIFKIISKDVFFVVLLKIIKLNLVEILSH